MIRDFSLLFGTINLNSAGTGYTWAPDVYDTQVVADQGMGEALIAVARPVGTFSTAGSYSMRLAIGAADDAGMTTNFRELGSSQYLTEVTTPDVFNTDTTKAPIGTGLWCAGLAMFTNKLSERRYIALGVDFFAKAVSPTITIELALTTHAALRRAGYDDYKSGFIVK